MDEQGAEEEADCGEDTRANLQRDSIGGNRADHASRMTSSWIALQLGCFGRQSYNQESGELPQELLAQGLRKD